MTPDLSYVEDLLWRAEQPGACPAPFVDCPPASAAFVALGRDFNREAMTASLEEVLHRHEVLRSTYVMNGGGPVRVIPPWTPVELGDIDPLADNLVEPFTLDRSPLLRVGIARLPDGEHVACLTVHRIVSDNASKAIIAGELRQRYDAHRTGARPSMPPALADYGDYVTWQHGVADGPTGRALLDFWTDKLRGIDPAGLPGDGAAAAGHASTESASHLFNISATDTSRLRTLCRVQRVTIATTLLAMVDLFLHRTAGIEDIVIGVPVSHRRRYEFEHVVGQFTNLVIIRTTVTSRMEFTEVLQRVRAAAAEAYQYQDLPYGYRARLLGGERSLPLYRVVFNFNRAEPPPSLPPPCADVTFTPALVLPPPHAFADFTIQIHDRVHDLGCRFVYKADLFTRTRVADFARRFEMLVTELLDRAAVTAPAREKRA
jgi:hypothetical protein